MPCRQGRFNIGDWVRLRDDAPAGVRDFWDLMLYNTERQQLHVFVPQPADPNYPNRGGGYYTLGGTETSTEYAGAVWECYIERIVE